MKKGKAILACMALAAALMLGLAVPAFAADAPVVNKTQQLNVDDIGSMTDNKYKFDIEAIALDTNVQGVQTSTDAPLPIIADIYTDGNETKSTTVQFGTWPHAGTYAWKVTERQEVYSRNGTTPMTIPSKVEIQFDPQVYTIIADVKNAAQGGGFEVNYVVIKGLATSTENLPGDKVASLDFTNKITQYNNTGISITKEVTGNGGDKTKQFEFTVTFTIPANSILPANKTAADVLNEITTDAAGGATVTQDAQVGPGATTREFKFTAADANMLKFNNILYGATWSITETPVGGYTQSWQYYHEGNNNVPSTNMDNIPAYANDCTMTNTYDVTPPTALILNNLPFILMGLLAVAGLVVYGTVKKKLAR